jgi:hypothetical protein
VEAGTGQVALEPADHARAELLLMADQTPDLSPLPEQLRTKLAGELSRKPQDELRRRVGIFLLPVVVVREPDGGSLRTAYLVGSEQRVHAPDARGLGPLFRAWLGTRRR